MASVLGVALLGAAGCDKSSYVPLELGLRPTVELTVAPQKGDSVSYVVNLEWVGSDPDGFVAGYQYAVDPPAMPQPGNDTSWVDTQATRVELRLSATRAVETLPPPGAPLPSSDYHTIVLRAIDDDGRYSLPVSRSFTAYTVAPFSDIVFPDGNSQVAILIPPESLRVAWVGNDPDGSQGPVTYKVRLARADEINPAAQQSITCAMVQAFFGADAPRFVAAGWDSLPGDSTTFMLRGLVPGVRYYFAVVAFDESGAYEPRFHLDSNVLQFIPVLNPVAPSITVFNEFFTRTQAVGGVSLDPSRIFRIEYPANTPITFNWWAQPTQPGVLIDGYRWAVDIVDITDETPRSGPDDLAHWSPWSMETSVTIGPFPPDSLGATHHFRLQARDQLGYISMLTIGFTIVTVSHDRDLLLVDDLYGAPTMLENLFDPRGIYGKIRLVGAYPLEAEQDSFYVAVGGMPDSLYIRSEVDPTRLSLPGAFADFRPDTLDYRFYPVDGIPLSVLARYEAVAWYTDIFSSARNGSKFGSATPMTALRAINSVNRLNTLALYLRQGGKVFLFGEGATTAIANGYFSRYGGPPRVPYTSGEDPRQNVLFPGNFLYDFCHLRSELDMTQLRACQPFLPAYRPLDPGAARTAQRWADLPRLTIASYRNAPAESCLPTWIINAPNFVPEMDTLYLHEACVPDPDQFPNAVHYYGPDNGPGSQLVWFGFPLHYFEREQVRTVVGAVMRNFGVERQPGAGRVARRR